MASNAEAHLAFLSHLPLSCSPVLKVSVSLRWSEGLGVQAQGQWLGLGQGPVPDKSPCTFILSWGLPTLHSTAAAVGQGDPKDQGLTSLRLATPLQPPQQLCTPPSKSHTCPRSIQSASPDFQKHWVLYPQPLTPGSLPRRLLRGELAAPAGDPLLWDSFHLHSFTSQMLFFSMPGSSAIGQAGCVP